MAVEVNSTRKAVEIAWDELGESGGIEEPPVEEKPPGFPAHPIAPGGGETPTHPIAPGGEAPDQGLPPSGVGPSHPIYLPPYIDNELPGGGADGIWGPTDPRPQPPIELPPDIGLSDEQKQKLEEFLHGNLPPHTEPHGGKGKGKSARGGKQIAVQVFAQGQEGDWSNTPVMPNDGLAVLTYPQDFTGESYVEVRALDGSLVDSGTIQVK